MSETEAKLFIERARAILKRVMATEGEYPVTEKTLKMARAFEVDAREFLSREEELSG